MKTKHLEFRGLVAALFTPFHEDGSLDLGAIKPYTEFLLKKPLNALLINGSTGEFASMTTEERLTVAEHFIAAGKGRLPMIVHVGSPCLDEAVELARHAKAVHADGVVACAPFYFIPGIPQAIEYLSKIAAACAPLPFYYYHMPASTHVKYSAYDLLQAEHGQIPNFAGIKYTDENLMDFQLCIDLKRPHFQMLYGRDEILLAALAMGTPAAVGSTYNFAPTLYHHLWEAFQKGDIAAARRDQHLSQQFVQLLHRYGNAAQKVFLREAGVPMTAVMRTPQPTLDQAADAALLHDMDALKLRKYLG